MNVPERVKEISKHSFENCASLSSITLPDGLDEIRRYAFSGCGSLKYVRIPERTTYLDISSFGGLASIRHIVIPKSVTVITGHDSFKWDSLSADLCYAGDKDDWGRIDFGAHYGCVNSHVMTGEFSKRVRFYSEEKPSAKGKYWHYGEAGKVENW